MSLFKPTGSSPLTTKGDLFAYGANDNQRLPVGTDGLFLKADSSVTLGLSYASPAGAALSVTTITSSVTLGSSIDVAYVSGGTFTITLPNAASFPIKPIQITKSDASSTTPIFINGLLNGSTNWAFYTQYETFNIITSGSVWQIVNHTGYTNELFLTIGNGHGSVGTKVRRFSAINNNTIGTYATYADSVTLGMLVTINIPGIYSVAYSDEQTNGGEAIGLVVNCGTSLTVSVSGISYTQGLRGRATVGTANCQNVPLILKFNSLDNIRTMTEGGANNTTEDVMFRLSRIGD